MKRLNCLLKIKKIKISILFYKATILKRISVSLLANKRLITVGLKSGTKTEVRKLSVGFLLI